MRKNISYENDKKKVKMDIKIVRNGHENSSNEQKIVQMNTKIVQMDKKIVQKWT